MSIEFLKVKRDYLAQEAKIIRRKEQKYKKWTVKTIVQDVPFGDNILKSLEKKGWQAKVLPAPRGRPGMTEEERQAYREKVWKHRARMRRLNRAHDPVLRHQLQEHRIKVVRPEARHTHLAIAYLKGQPYNVVETLRKDEYGLTLNRPLLEKIWGMVHRFGKIEDTPENKAKVEGWLKG